MRFFYFYFAILLVSSSPSFAAIVSLNNGDRISGDIISQSPTLGVWLKTGFGQMLQVPWEHIRDINQESAAGPAAKPTSPSEKNSNRVILKPPPYDNTSTANLSRTTIAENSSVDHPDTPGTKKESPVKWTGRINLGATLQDGNSREKTFNGDAETKLRWGQDEQHRATFKAEINREEDDGNVSENNRKIEGAYDYFYTKKWFINNTLSFEQDDIEHIDLRTKAGVGLGHQAWDEEDKKLQYVLGPTYLREDYEGSSKTQDSIAARWALDYEQKVFRDMFTLFHDHELLVPTDDTEDFLLVSKTGMRVPIRKGLVGTAEVDFDWDNKPEPGVKEDDTTYSLKLGYEW